MRSRAHHEQAPGAEDCDGASGNSPKEHADPHQCQRCGYKSSKYTDFAYLKSPPDNGFAANNDMVLAKAISYVGGVNPQNLASEEVIIFTLTCINCCAMMHGTSYHEESGPRQGKYTSQWMNLSKGSKAEQRG